MQVAVCRHTNCNMADMTCFNPLNAELNPICHLLALLGAHHILHVSRIRVKAMLIIFSEILKKTKEKLNYCTICQCQNIFICEVHVSIATRKADTKIWINTGYEYLNRSVNALANLHDMWHCRINNQSLVRHSIV